MVKTERAQPADAEKITQLNRFVHKLHVAAHPDIFKPADEEETTRFFELLLSDQKNYFYLAYSDKTPVGYIWAQLERSAENALMYERARIYIHHVSVDENYQRQGVGSVLVEAISKLASEVEITKVALDTWSFNKEAQEFFERKGFEVFNVRMWQEFL